MSRVLAATVVLSGEEGGAPVVLLAGETPSPEQAALITNEKCWVEVEDDEVVEPEPEPEPEVADDPAADDDDSESPDDESDDEPEADEPEAESEAPAKPARSRK